jgi:hypothetical protein
VLTLKFAQEKARKSREPIVMFQIDLSKAYDRVEHFFMWGLLSAVGFADKFIALIKGLAGHARHS